MPEETHKTRAEGASMINRAIEIAVKAHEKQLRKGTEIPYIVHPLSVGIILAKGGAPEEVIVAGILHDTIEDTDVTFEEIREIFGESIANIVKGASESDKSLPWEERKQHTIDSLASESIEVLLVICADKLDNLRSIASEYQRIGEVVWKRFRRGKESQFWYYSSVARGLEKKLATSEYRHVAEDLKAESQELFGERGEG